MPVTNPTAALLAAAILATSPVAASETGQGDVSPVAERPDRKSGETKQPVSDDAAMPPAFHAPGPDVGMRDPAPVRRSPVWIPPNVTDNSKAKSVSPN